MARKRWPMMIGGLLAAGAAVGAAGALVRRRRSRRTWDEYPTPGDPAATRTERTSKTERPVSSSVNGGPERAATSDPARDRI